MVILKNTSFFRDTRVTQNWFLALLLKHLTEGRQFIEVILKVTLSSSWCPSKNDMTFKIITWSKFNNDQSQVQ